MQPGSAAGFTVERGVVNDTESFPEAGVEIPAEPVTTSLDGDGASTAAPEAAAYAGQTIGRYEIVALLGAGGMSQVFTAIDLELRRTVALKLMRPDGNAPRPLARARLRREAHALAKLQHPNVVAVYDVGTKQDQVFVAMELVPGRTLGAWLAERPRTWNDVRDVFLAAGRGLAAAHSVGIVHRDFKPSNVIVGESRVVVVDFGLARSHGDGLSSDDEERMAIPTPLHVDLTSTGDRPGTLRYMAPEQHLIGPVTELADQYAFAATLWEALYGSPPFAGANSAEIVEAMSRPLPLPPADRKVTDRVRAALARALAFRPEDRWPTLVTLLEELGRDPMAARRRLLGRIAIAVAAVAAPAAFLVGTRVSSPIDPCDGGTRLAAGSWDDAARAHARAAFAASGRQTAEASFQRVDAAMHDKLAAWAAAHRDTCEATRVRHVQSEVLLDARMACLERARGELRAFVDALGRDLDGNAVDRAVGTSARALDLAACQEASAPPIGVQPPRDPDAARLVTELGADVDRLQADFDLGRAKATLAEARTLLPRARGAGYSPLLIQALTLAGRLETSAGDMETGIDDHFQAAHAAAAAHDDIAYARALAFLIRPVGEFRGRLDEANGLVRLAEGAAARASSPDLLVFLFRQEGDFFKNARRDYVASLGRLGLALALEQSQRRSDSVDTGLILNSIGGAELNLGRVADAIEHYRLAIDVLVARLGPDHPYVTAAQTNLATADEVLGNWESAADIYALDLERSERDYGRESLNVLIATTNLANVRSFGGRLIEARQLIDRSLGLAERIIGPQNPEIARVLNVAADVALQEGKVDEAVATMRRAVATVEAALGADDSALVSYLMTLTDAELAAGDVPQARLTAARTVALVRKTDADSPDLSEAIQREAAVLAQERRHREAVPRFESALSLAEKVHGPEHPIVMWILAGAVDSLAATGQAPRAVAFAERARGIASTHGPRVLAESELALARAMAADGRDRARAVAVAQAARARLEGTGCRRLQQQVDAWLTAATR